MTQVPWIEKERSRSYRANGNNASKVWEVAPYNVKGRGVGETMTRDSESLFDRIRQHIIVILAVNTTEQMLTWQYILVAYGQLEALALELLRLHRGEDEQTFWGKNRLPTLTVAANELGVNHLAPEEIIQICRKVAALRNSVTHKQLLYGMTTYASYNDKLLFDSDYAKKHFVPSDMPISGVNEEAVENLLEEVDRALTVLSQLGEEAAHSHALRLA